MEGTWSSFFKAYRTQFYFVVLIPSDASDIKQEYKILLTELEKYNPELLDKMLAISKSDLLDDELKQELKKELQKGSKLYFFLLWLNMV